MKPTNQLRQNAQLQCVVIQVMLFGGGALEGVNSGSTKNPNLQGSYNKASHCFLSYRSEQNPFKIRHIVNNFFIV